MLNNGTIIYEQQKMNTLIVFKTLRETILEWTELFCA